MCLAQDMIPYPSEASIHHDSFIRTWHITPSRQGVCLCDIIAADVRVLAHPALEVREYTMTH